MALPQSQFVHGSETKLLELYIDIPASVGSKYSGMEAVNVLIVMSLTTTARSASQFGHRISVPTGIIYNPPARIALASFENQAGAVKV